MRTRHGVWGLLVAGSMVACLEHPTASWADITTSLTPPPAYARWWQELEECTGLTGDFSTVAWEVVAGDVIPRKEQDVAGVYWRNRRLIQLAESWVTHSGIVKHEMLHALSPVQGHGHWAYMISNPCGVTPYEYNAWAPELDHDLDRGIDAAGRSSVGLGAATTGE